MPRKEIYLRFETEPDAEFEFYLAQKLGKTVGQLQREMSNQEFLAWSIYYQRIVQLQELEAAKGSK